MGDGYHRTVSLEEVKPKSRVLEVALVILLVLVFAAIFMPLQTGGTTSRMTHGLSNSKQVGLGLLLYESDYDDLIPYVQSSQQLVGLTRPYVKNDELWQTLNDDRPGLFQMNMCLAGAKATELKAPETIPALYDPYGRKSKGAPETSSKFVVAFVDGHARALPEAKWNEASKYLTLSPKRYGKPLR